MTELSERYPGYNVLSAERSPEQLLVNLEAQKKPEACPTCSSTHIVGFGSRHQNISDLPLDGVKVLMSSRVRRFRCNSCDKLFKEDLPLVDDKRSLTSRLIEWINQQAAIQPFTSIAHKVGLSENNIRLIFADFIESSKQSIQPNLQAPSWVALNKPNIVVKQRLVINDLSNQRVADVLKDEDPQNLIQYLSEISFQSPFYVLMGPWPEYRKALKSCEPVCKIIIDPVYMIELVNAAMEKFRQHYRAELNPEKKRHLAFDQIILSMREKDLTKEDQSRLVKWSKKHPTLVAFYKLKEAFLSIYDARTSDDAKDRYKAFLNGIPEPMVIHFTQVITNWTEWEENIVEYFNQPDIAKMTALNNNLIARIKNINRGYSFDAVRSAILGLN